MRRRGAVANVSCHLSLQKTHFLAGILTLLLQPTPGMFEKSNFVKHDFSSPPAKIIISYALLSSFISASDPGYFRTF